MPDDAPVIMAVALLNVLIVSAMLKNPLVIIR
jgi:hypothetical protein